MPGTGLGMAQARAMRLFLGLTTELAEKKCRQGPPLREPL